jgi:solute carrier family 45 protein 1/2/4
MPSSSTVILRHSDSEPDSDEELEHELSNLSYSLDAVSSSPTGVAPIRRRQSPALPKAGSNSNTADKAGVILGIHNVFVVLPQFVVTLMASIIFHIMEPGTGGEALPGKHPNAIPIGNGTISDIDVGEVVRLVVREGGMEGGSSDAVGLIFRYVFFEFLSFLLEMVLKVEADNSIGGVAAAIGGFICLRLGQDWAKGRGL